RLPASDSGGEILMRLSTTDSLTFV
ncbi:MAG: hypothetical protein RLZZ458_846, partial [Planctomycetota bacterium]